MAEAFDPYASWLGLPAGGGKPNYYQLFGLSEGESDPERIAVAADRAMAKVRSFRPGPNAAAWSRLLDEIHAAKTCLLEPNDKSEYDQSLRSAAPAAVKAESKPSEPAAPMSQLPGRQDFYPPGMGPPRGASAPSKPADDLSPPKPKPASPAANPAPRANPAPLADMAPPASSAPAAKAANPAPQAESTMPVPSQYAPAQAAAPQQPGMQPMPSYGGAPAAMPTAAPAWGAPVAAPYPQQQHPQPYPQQPYPQPGYPQQPYGQQPGMPTGFPGSYPGAWPQQGYPGGMPAGMPMSPMGAPGYPAAMPMGMPMPGMAPMASPMTPYDPLGGMAPPPLAQPLSPYDPMGMNPYGLAPPGQNYPPAAPPPQMMPDPMSYGGISDPSLDPMAPVSIPGMGGPGQSADAAWGSGYGGNYGATPPSAQPASGIPMGSAVPAAVPHGAPASAAVPTGKAVPAGGADASKGSAPAGAVPGKNAPQPVPGWNSSPSGLDGLSPRSEAQSQRTILVAGIGGGLALMMLGFAYLIYTANQGNGPEVTEVDPESNNVIDPNPMPIDRTVQSNDPPIRPTPIPQPPRPQPMPMPTPTPVPMPVEPKPMPMPTPMPMPVPQPPMPMPMPTPPPMPTPTPTPPTPTPTPTPTPPPIPETVVAPTKDELIALGKACTTAKDSLAEQNFDEASKQIAKAESLAKLPEHKAKVARLKEVAEYVKQFRAAVAAAVAEFEAAETFKVGSSTQVAVVETFPDKIIIRSAGVNKTYPFADLPAGLAVAIADFKLDGTDPVSRVVKGAYLAVQKGDDSSKLDKAKTWWEEAQLGGAPIAPLMPFLTDKYDFENEAK